MSRGVPMRPVGLILVWLAALAGVFAWPYLTGSPTPGDDLTRRTVWVALAFYVTATWQMLGLRPADWLATTELGRIARWCWTLGWASFVGHVGVAFHVYHHWSHVAAVEHVRERSGVGEGVFASYLFTAAWTADVAWWWLRPAGYASRPVWVHRALHGFMTFMIVMATVVYEAGAVRLFGLVIFGALIFRFATLRSSVPISHASTKRR